MSTISPETRQELVTAVADRYRQSTAAEKRLILDEFVALTGYHRKHAVRVLNGSAITPRARRGRRCVYDAAAVGGVGPDLREASEGAPADLGPGARASRPLVPGLRGARAAPGGECRDDRPPPGVRAGRDGRSTPAPALRAERVAGQRAGADVRRLEGPGSRFRRGRSRRALRRDAVRQLRLVAGADRYRQRVDGMRPAPRARSTPGGRRAGSSARRAAVPAPRDRHGQRQRLPQRGVLSQDRGRSCHSLHISSKPTAFGTSPIVRPRERPHERIEFNNCDPAGLLHPAPVVPRDQQIMGPLVLVQRPGQPSPDPPVGSPPRSPMRSISSSKIVSAVRS